MAPDPQFPFDPTTDPRAFAGGPEVASGVPKPVKPDAVDLSTLVTDREITQKEQVLAEDAQAKSEEERIAREKAELASVSERLKAAEDAQMAQVKASREAVDAAYRALPPQESQKPLVNSQDFQNFSLLLTGIALIGGAASRGDWLGVQATMNGAMEGYLDGNRERAEREHQAYRQQFDTAYKKLEASQKEYEEVVYSSSLPINQIQREFSTLAAMHGREDAIAAARSGRIDKMRDRVAHYDEVIARLKQGDEKLDIQWELGLAKMNASRGGIAVLNEDGKWAVESIYFGTGNRKPMQDILSRFGGQTAAFMWNDIGKFWRENHVDPKQWTAQQMLVNADQKAMNLVVVQQQGVKRVQGSIQELQPKIEELVRKVNGTNPNLANKYWNTLKGDMLGDFNISELSILAAAMGREWVRAVTAATSNAQLHVSAQELSDKLVSRDFSLQSLLGAMAGINYDLKSFEDSSTSQIQTIKSNVTTESIPTPGMPNASGLPDAPPPSVIKYDRNGNRVPP